MDTVRKRRSSQWLWSALIWSGVGLFDATQNVFVMRSEGMHHAWGRLFLRLFIAWVPWALATPGVLFLGRRYPPTRLRPTFAWGIHLAGCLGIGLVFASWVAGLDILLNPWLNPGPPEPYLRAWRETFYNGLLADVILYGLILAIGYVLDSRERLTRQQTETARLNEQLSKARLNALRRQIEPHFLFNTLNAIAGLVREGRNDAAVSMIAGLSDFLRRVVEDSTRQEVPLGEEIEFLQKYVDIQKVRFGERLEVTVEIPQELFSAQVPSLILQPMVENAVKHGIAKRVQGGAIRVSAERSNGRLRLNVYNDGPQLPEDWAESGIGIPNVRARLRSLYGEAFELTMRNREPDGVEASVSVPFALAPVKE